MPTLVTNNQDGSIETVEIVLPGSDALPEQIDSCDEQSEDESDKENMGGQSQNRNGSIKTMKKRGGKQNKSKKNKKQKKNNENEYAEKLREEGGKRYEMNGYRLFIPEVSCKTCKWFHNRDAYELAHGRKTYPIKKPKKGHHQDCPNKPCNKEEQAKIAFKHSTLGHGVREMTLVMNRKQNVATADTMDSTTATVAPRPSAEVIDYSPRGIALDIRCELEGRWKSFTEDYKYPWAKTSRAPALVALAADYIWKKFCWRREPNIEGALPFTDGFKKALDIYHKYFPEQTCEFTFPKDVTDPSRPSSPLYHQLDIFIFRPTLWQRYYNARANEI